MAKHRMLMNYVPGEECRVAVVTDGKLEELHAERLNAISHVGNIYVGKVMNVEPAIQAAFVDFGLEHNGFLHISDLHPRYFPGGDDERTEQVGKKTPRRNRPPIQEALRRGQEIVVQVLKEGIGTKGPTLTSYLSIPGRFLVMMPDMDNVGVSRKVEDEEQRRAMRQILDQLELPESFGFILRTAGMDRTKAELKRDLAYLQRLWKDLERRRKQGGKPRLLYAESDLLVRALRDVLSSEVEEIVIDDPLALRRAAKFLKIISPRSSVKLLEYDRVTPIFHAFGVEEQIKRIFSREVPLPSGGSLVIDETEALIAIDVNSGKMRSHGDAETTAYKTNVEAVDEICRQLRLRDLGGLVINDLIDMRSRSHQRDIESRFRENLKKDRARSKTLPVSQFGIIEMTRQRMRGSLRSVHFAPCPHCAGRGQVQRPDSVAADAIRDLACILQHDRVHRVEMVVAPRVAGELLSHKRVRLGQLERQSGKHVDVRVSETIAVDHIAFYAYDERGADIEIDRLPRPQPPADLPMFAEVRREVSESDWAVDSIAEAEAVQAEPELAAAAAEAEEFGFDLMEIDDATAEAELSGGGAAGEGRKKRRRRRRRGRGGREEDEQQAERPQRAPQRGARGPMSTPAPALDGPSRGDSWDIEPDEAPPSTAPMGGEAQEIVPLGDEQQGEGGRRRRRRRRRRGRGGADGAPTDGQPGAEAMAVVEPKPVQASSGRGAPGPGPDAQGAEQEGEGEGGGRKRRRRRRRRRRGGAPAENGMPAVNGEAPSDWDEPVGAAGPGRDDSWDIAPSELASPSTPVGGQDSWDVAPEELAPAVATAHEEAEPKAEAEAEAEAEPEVEVEADADEAPAAKPRGARKKKARAKAATKKSPSKKKSTRSRKKKG